ncbi:MAG: hypothetical protein J6Y03_04985 [Alphaproteobacteria bacterium]|nr:hypothetical protein [Alphaproteobacteria bacterium]
MAENLMQNQNNNNEIPAKFLDAKGKLNADALLQSYLELEKKLGSMVHIPSADASEDEKKVFYQKIGVPANADDYKLEIKNELLASDPEVNQRLCNLGFTNAQVQAVYDLAAEKVLPVIEELAQDYEASRQRVLLENHFGGKERFEEVARQITLWAKQNVLQEVFDALSTTYEGVLTLYKMMENGEPAILPKGAPVNEILDEEGLKKLMMSPKYWRDQDPATLKKVSDGFNRLYPNK